MPPESDAYTLAALVTDITTESFCRRVKVGSLMLRRTYAAASLAIQPVCHLAYKRSASISCDSGINRKAPTKKHRLR
jgi:hypothetical protein